MFDSPFFAKMFKFYTEVTNRLTVLEAKVPVRVDIKLGAGGVGTADLTALKLADVPKVDQIHTVTGTGDNTVVVFPVVTALSKTSVTVSGKKTKGTLLLSAGPITQCAANDVVSLWITPK